MSDESDGTCRGCRQAFMIEDGLEHDGDVCHPCRIAELEAQVAALRGLAESFAEVAEAAVRNAENRGKGGQQVPFHGDFAGAVQMPGITQNLRWWARHFRGVLAGVG